MTDVRNQRLATLTTTDVNSAIGFRVPDGHVILLKGIVATNVAAAAGDAVVMVFGPAQALYTFFATLEPFAGQHEEIWVAMNPGDEALVQSTVTPMRFWLSGAVLAGPPPFPTLPTATRSLDELGLLLPEV